MGKTLTEMLATPPPSKRECLVSRVVKENPQDSEAILAAVNSPRWSGAAIMRVLEQHDIKCSASSINNHRTGACSCRKIKA